MIEADAVFAEPPAEINLFVVDQCREIEQTNFKIFDEATCLKDAMQGGFHALGELLMLYAQRRQLLVGNDDPAHHHDSRGNGGEIRFQACQLLAAIHRFDEERFDFLAGAFRLRQGEQAGFLFWFLAFVFVVVFVSHCGFQRSGAYGMLMLAQTEHTVESHAREMARPLIHRDLVDHVPGGQILEGPQQVLRRNAKHRGANANAGIQRDDFAIG
jgi:hypothetical protein